ncbi:MAG: radical SAM protein [Hyphomicrobiales bacterium]|nr:radical SAM protein [Hyphomicrobiales bacterium]
MGSSMLAPATREARRFQLVLIKPSHYDDDGYVIQWLRSGIPSNSLACLYALAEDARRRHALGPDVTIDLTAIDETNSRVRCGDIIRQFQQHGGFGLIGLVGVQSNQFPRALDIARQLRAAAIPVAIGGFHVSGCLAMLPQLPPDLQEALDLGCSLFAGEAENGRIDAVLQDAADGRLKPIYNFMNDLPAIEETPPPYLPAANLKRTVGYFASFDAGRGCPFQCSFCTIINVQGRKSRRRSPDDIERLIRRHAQEGFRWYFVTDDNFARNKDWEPIFDRLAELREKHGFDIRLIIQVDTLCHKLPNFIAKARRAGVRKVFIGLENINPTNLIAAKKRQNKITEYRRMLLAWKQAGVITYAGYILGFPNDTVESIREDIAIIKKELPLDILEFFCLTPLPGSEDHKMLWTKGVAMDPDLNKYDLEHVVTAHARMSAEQWNGIYREAWRLYYTPEHVETILRRAAAHNVGISHLTELLLIFSRCVDIENVHPLQSGLFRRKYRLDRRSGLAPEPAWRFYPRYGLEIVTKHARMIWALLKVQAILRRVRKDPDRFAYRDQALTSVPDEEEETLELFTHSDDARGALTHARKVAALTGAKATASSSSA